MRRMVKERLLKFDGKPLFPERIAYTVPYRLSDAEARLYISPSGFVLLRRMATSRPSSPRASATSRHSSAAASERRSPAMT